MVSAISIISYKNIWLSFWISYQYFAGTCLLLEPPPNGGLVNTYLPNWCTNVVKYNNFLLHLRLWWPKLASTKVIQHAFVSGRSMSFTEGPLLTGLMSVSVVWGQAQIYYAIWLGYYEKAVIPFHCFVVPVFGVLVVFQFFFEWFLSVEPCT